MLIILKDHFSGKFFKINILVMMMANVQIAYAEEQTIVSTENENFTRAVLPTLKLEAMSELDPIKSYIDYDQANVTRNGLKKKDIPQTVDTLDVQKYKIYGSNDLSVMLQGTPGVSTNYDMRGDGILLRGFNADSGDIYIDGVRQSGQLRRSTANIERIEILKGPASVLYGRSGGGGVINMVSKFANFDSKSTVGVYGGSWDNLGTTLDLNKAINDNWAARLTSEYGESDSFRSGIHQRQKMFSPSLTYRNDDRTLLWTTQYTYDNLHRIPDRGPNAYNLPKNTSRDMGYAQKGDFVDDVSQQVRTDLKYTFAPNWNFHWEASYRQAEQNFDHFYLGTYCATDKTVISNRAQGTCNGHAGEVSQIYYWQNTINKTISHTWDITGEVQTGSVKHNLMVGTDWTVEQREAKLANQNADGSYIYGYVNPITGERSNTRTGGALKLNTDNYNKGDSYGVFLQDLISFNDQIKMMLGMRYDYYDFSTRNKLTDAFYQASSHSWSPNIGLIWQPTEHHSLYASYSKSFAPFGGSMGVNAVTSTIVNSEPQYNNQYEIGVKSDWFNQRLNTQLSAFDIRKKNIRYRPDATNFPDEWAVAGEHQSKGLEFSFIGRVMDDVFVRGGYGLTDAKVKKDDQTPANVGNRLALTSKNTGNLFVRYLPIENIYIESGVTYAGNFYNNIANDYKVKGFTRMDAALGYSHAPWNFTLAINNVTNRKYWRSLDLPGASRSVLARINYQF